jgi:hypothetical protein
MYNLSMCLAFFLSAETSGCVQVLWLSSIWCDTKMCISTLKLRIYCFIMYIFLVLDKRAMMFDIQEFEI